jgi:hypothetical protein
MMMVTAVGYLNDVAIDAESDCRVVTLCFNSSNLSRKEESEKDSKLKIVFLSKGQFTSSSNCRASCLILSISFIFLA